MVCGKSKTRYGKCIGIGGGVCGKYRTAGKCHNSASGKRLQAYAGITDIPVVVKNLDDDMATILLVDSNLQREHILPSEKAFAYQMKLEAMKRQGARTDLTSSQIATKLEKGRSDVELGEQVGESKDQIRRYIRLTNLIDPILDMVDNNQIAMNAAVEISYLGSKEQAAVMQSIEKEETSPSIAQARKMRKFHQEGSLKKGDFST